MDSTRLSKEDILKKDTQPKCSTSYKKWPFSKGEKLSEIVNLLLFVNLKTIIITITIKK